MTDFLARYISTISLAIGATLSLFNIGYYWKIGLHFLGLTDFSNLVYSFGVSLTALSLAAFAIAAVARFASSTWSLVLVAGLGGALSSWGIVHFTPRTTVPELEYNIAILIGFVLSGSAFAVMATKMRAFADWRNVAALCFGWSAIAFQAGVCQAAVELSDRLKYTVSTKSGVIADARILRASSSGFLLALGERVVFIPQGEVKEVTSQPAN
jgi:hypothetical protein